MDNHGPALTLARLTVAPALIVMAWLAVGLPLLMAHAFTIGPALLLFLPACAIALFLGFRGTQQTMLSADSSLRTSTRRAAARPASWWAVAGVVAVTLAFLTLQNVDQTLAQTAENQRLQATADHTDRDRIAALNRRLQSEIDDNARLHKELDDAHAKLDAIANIERNLSERKNPTEERPK